MVKKSYQKTLCINPNLLKVTVINYVDSCHKMTFLPRQQQSTKYLKTQRYKGAFNLKNTLFEKKNGRCIITELLKKNNDKDTLHDLKPSSKHPYSKT